jgi:hypothetical protein
MDIGKDRGRLLAALTALDGLVALGVSLAFGQLAAVKAAVSCMPADAVVRFELARSPADVPFLYGACRGQAAAAMDAVNHLDLAAFIPSYTAFCALAAVFLARRLGRPLVWAAIAAAVVTLVADVVETTTLLRITAGASEAHPMASDAAWTKFIALGVNASLLSAIAWTAAPRRPILGALLLLPVAATVWMTLDPSRSSLLNLAFMVSWGPVMLVAAKETILRP